MSWCRCSECIGGFAELSVKPGLRSSHRGGKKTAAELLEAPQSPSLASHSIESYTTPTLIRSQFCAVARRGRLSIPLHSEQRT